MSETALRPHHVIAVNRSFESENKIHDDAVAQRFGFKGGLVPGVEVYAYMTHLPVMRWGRAWLERGHAECRLRKPVYHSETAIVTAAETPSGLEIRVESGGETCLTGVATLPAGPNAPPAAFAETRLPPQPPAPQERPPADETSLAVGTRLMTRPFRASAEYEAQYLRDIGESLPLYAAEGLVHPGTLLHFGNWVLRENVALGPWMHVGSTVDHFGLARIDEELMARAVVTANYEHRGHRFVEADVLVYGEASRPIARIAHTAIYRPRQLAAA
jgi:hypothetical protein